MREDLSRAKMHKAIDSTLSGLNGDPWLFQRVSARAAEGERLLNRWLFRWQLTMTPALE